MRRQNPWVAAHDQWYARATPSERESFDASRECSRSKVFVPKQFDAAPGAWARFLTLQRELPEVLAGTPLPLRLEVKGQVRVYEALQNQTKALARIAACATFTCRVESTEVRGYRMTGEEGIQSDMYLCPSCKRWREIDPMYGISTIAPLP